MRPSRDSIRRHATVPTLVFGALGVSASFAAVAAGGTAVTPPPGRTAPAQLSGSYRAQFTVSDEQTAGTWHLRVGPGHHLGIWNPKDDVANSPSFEGGPVSFRGDRMIFARSTAEGVCTVGATYRWTYRNGVLRFRLLGRDLCHPRVITFTPHPWRRSS